MKLITFKIYSAGSNGKMIKTDNEEYSYLNTGLILNVTLYNNMMRISTLVANKGDICTFVVS